MQTPDDVHGKLIPKIFESFDNYSFKDLYNDIMAGLTVSIVALPLAMAFAIASDVPPIFGVYTAIIAGILGVFFTGCKLQISGPSGALVVLSYSVLYQYGYAGMAVTMLMTGILLALGGIFKLGAFVKFIPYPVTIGYSAAIGFIILSQQVSYLLGLPIESLPPDFFSKVLVYVEYIGEFSLTTIILSLITMLIMIIAPRFSGKVPPHVFAVGIGIVLTVFFALPVQTIGTEFGAFKFDQVNIFMPELSLELIRKHFSDALVLALLIAMESLLTALVADGSTTTDTHYSNMELISQGISNIVCGIFGAIPSTGATSRTLTNIHAGAVSPLSGLFHAVFLIIFLIFFPMIIEAIPLCSLAIVLVFMAKNMVNKRGILTIFLTSKSDIVIFLLTFGLTVIFDLTVGVYVGVTFASLAFMQKVSDHTSITGVNDEIIHPLQNDTILEMPPEIKIVQIDGPLCFGVADRFNHAFALSDTGKSIKPKVYILHMKHVSVMDSTGIHVMDAFLARSGERHYKVVISSPSSEVQTFLRRIHAIDIIGEENVCSTLDDAIDRAYLLLMKIDEQEEKKHEQLHN